WVRCRTEDDLAFLREVVGRLVARAQQVVRVLFIERNWAANVGANLGVGDDTVDVPVFAAFTDLHVFWVQTHQQYNSFCFLVELVVLEIQQTVRYNVQGRTNGYVLSLDWGTCYVTNQSCTGIPHRVAHALYTEV